MSRPRVVGPNVHRAALALACLVAAASCGSSTKRPEREVVVINGHAEAFVAWAERGARARTVVHVDAHDDFRPLKGEQLERLREIVGAGRFDLVARRLASGADELMNEGDFLYAAAQLGLIDEIYWVVGFGSRAAPELHAADRRALREMGFSEAQLRSFRVEQGRLTGDVHGVELTVCGMADLPKLREPVLLDIDIDLFSILARAQSTPIAESLAAFRRDLVASGLKFDIATVARSVDDGFTLLGHAYVAVALSDLLASPSLTLPTRRWETLRLRSTAEAQHEAGQYRAAVATAGRILEESPDDAPAHYRVALSSFQLGDYAAAHDHAARAARIDPTYEGGLIALGESLASRGDEAALRFFDTAEALAPDSPRLIRARGDYYFRKQLYRLALEHYAKLEIENDMGLAMRMGDAYMLLENYSDGLMYYELGMRIGERARFPITGRFGSSWLLLGRYYEHVVDNPQRARGYYDRYLAKGGGVQAERLAEVKRVSKLYDDGAGARVAESE